MKNILITTLVLLVAAAVVYTITDDEESSSEIITMNVASKKVDCVGVGPQKCLVVNDLFFYDQIEGFEHEEGFEYVLDVERTERENVPADASIYNYKLVEIVSKTAVAGSGSSLAPIFAYNWQWQESKFNGGNTTVPADPSKFELVFMDENRFSSTTDCNNVTGEAVINNGTEISFGMMASTRMACPGETLEQEYTDTLSEITELLISGLGEENPTLSLKHENGEMIFRGFAK